MSQSNNENINIRILESLQKIREDINDTNERVRRLEQLFSNHQQSCCGIRTYFLLINRIRLRLNTAAC